jgi:5'-methylthioadenosine phosphorylase
MPNAVILGSAFSAGRLGGRSLEPVEIPTRFGPATLHRYPGDRAAYVLFRHGAPHRLLPNQVPYRAQAAALREVGCDALLITSSVGVMDASVPLFEPLIVEDLLMPDNRLPDGSACTMFPAPVEGQGHLVIEEGLLSRVLSAQIEALIQRDRPVPVPRVVFTYVGGPRTKTAAENALWARLGAQVNSMSVGPEVVLANELEIPVAAVVVGHKHSVPGVRDRLDPAGMSESLRLSQAASERLVVQFLEEAKPVPFRNRLHRF